MDELLLDSAIVERYAHLTFETTKNMPAEGVLFWARVILGVL